MKHNRTKSLGNMGASLTRPDIMKQVDLYNGTIYRNMDRTE